MTYTYDPTQIRARGKDQMRFELGDTQVDGGAATCALSDEEYTAMLEDVDQGHVNTRQSNHAWLLTKLEIVEAILLKLSYQVNTRIDVLSYGLGDRAQHWKDLYEMLKAELLGATGAPRISDRALKKPPYFHTDMKTNRRAQPLSPFPFRKMTT
jgi:hypothetical protein